MGIKFRGREEQPMNMKNYKWVSFVLCLAMIFSGFGGVGYAATETPEPDLNSTMNIASPEAITSASGITVTENTAPIALTDIVEIEMNETIKISVLAYYSGPIHY